MFGNVKVNTILLLLLAFEQNWLDRVNKSGGIGADVENLLDGLHDLFALHLIKLGLGDWHDESHIATISKKHFDGEVVDALCQIVVGASHAWQVSEDLFTVNRKVRHE